MSKLLIDFLENKAKRYLRSSNDLDANFHSYRGIGKGKDTIIIDTLNSDNFKDAVFNNNEVILFIKY